MNYEICNENCLEGMKRLEDDSVDCIISNLPYNLTDCAWDKSAVDLQAMRIQFKRIIKPCSAVILFASEKFAHKLTASNLEKYKWIWIENAPASFVHAKNAPMHKFEEILIFSDGAINHASCSKLRMKYNPQGLIKGDRHYSGRKSGNVYGDHNGSLSHAYTAEYRNYPNDILHFKKSHAVGQNYLSEKPVALLEYLIKRTPTKAR